ncbi:MAG: hypothetical protein HYU66_12000 [Armatimonadetes bacterium]|nr:hypothetical protein [Armatimonadota bacterium]
MTLPAVLLLALPSMGGVTRDGGTWVVTAGATEVRFDAGTGAIVGVSQTGRAGGICRGGENGLWLLQFGDGKTLDAAGYRGKPAITPQGDALRLAWTGGEADVTVTAAGTADGVALTAEVAPRGKVITALALPGRLRFDPAGLERMVWPQNGNSGVGLALNRKYFERQPEDQPHGWSVVHEQGGPAGYQALYGGGLDQKADQIPPAKLTVPPAAREWLGEAVARRVESSTAMVNRPCTRSQAELVLADSADGPFFCGSSLGGQGRLWRLGGAVGEREEALALDLVTAVIDKLAANPGARPKIGLVDLLRGPARGSWCIVEIDRWLDRLRRLPAVAAGRCQVVSLTGPAAMLAAAESEEFLAVLNPYGEAVPVPAGQAIADVVAAVGRYVKAGGNWFEVGGYPFYYALRPLRFMQMTETYPTAFADFVHLDGAAGSLSMYRVQPRDWEPWAGAQDPRAIFVPGWIACGGDEQGGWTERKYAAWVAAGSRWTCPPVRLVAGRTAADDLATYCAANQINRGLADKVPAAVLPVLKSGVMVKYDSPFRQDVSGLPKLPAGSLLHFSNYLHGGFDKQYPDHLPPHPSQGTPQELREFFDRAHVAGQLLMPYTNPTWWCDEPKGPTFEREGDAPLLRGLDGKLSFERYAQNVGWTVCHWHPAVQAANRETVRQFSADYPVDVLFQDQCGARGWHWDTNPASPTPYAYTEGLLSQVDEDSRRKPLSTECGWDRVVNGETQLCGMSWGIVPTEGGPSWITLLREQVPTETWTIFPLAEYIAHDKTMMLHHDLGQFVTNREVLSWTLGLGFSLSVSCPPGRLGEDGAREWLNWLDRLQKSVVARYIGEPVRSFEHVRGTPEAKGVIRAAYGPVELVANLDAEPRSEAGHRLAGHGFRATAPGLVAGNLASVGGREYAGDGLSFVAEARGKSADVWVYSPQEREVAVELPGAGSGQAMVTFDGSAAGAAAVKDGLLAVRLPHRAGKPRVDPPPEVAGKPLRERPGEKPSVGVIDLGAGAAPTWTSVQPAAWVAALERSKLGVVRRRESLRRGLPRGGTGEVAGDAGGTAGLRQPRRDLGRGGGLLVPPRHRRRARQLAGRDGGSGRRRDARSAGRRRRCGRAGRAAPRHGGGPRAAGRRAVGGGGPRGQPGQPRPAARALRAGAPGPGGRAVGRLHRRLPARWLGLAVARGRVQPQPGGGGAGGDADARSALRPPAAAGGRGRRALPLPRQGRAAVGGQAAPPGSR